MILARLKGGHKRFEVSFIAKHLEVSNMLEPQWRVGA